MPDPVVTAATAVWLGILTSISPCPLATNVAAISFIARRLDRPRHAILSGLLYTLGRSLVYTTIAVLVIGSLVSAPVLSHWLQRNMIRLLGPLLVVAGAVLLGLFRPASTGAPGGAGLQARAERMGMWGGGLLGIVFALSFCPVSAALFFGSLVPLATTAGSTVFLPLLYGVGTALPVVVFAILVATGARSLGRLFDAVTAVERWARRATGVLFVLIGLWFVARYTFHLF